MDAIAVRELDFSYGSSRILKKIDLTGSLKAGRS